MEHSIRFRREGTQVQVLIDTDLPHMNPDGDKTIIALSYNCNSLMSAELLLRYLQTRHENAMQAIRKQEFCSGWKHAKAKKKVRAFFGWFMPNMRQQATHESEMLK